MQLFVRDLQGQTHVRECSPSDQAGSLGVASDERLIIAGRSLSVGDLIGDVEDQSTVFITAGLEGGAKKRKKKTYTKPKKIKHKRKKVKLAVLKLYKVDSNEKVTMLRKVCPSETCGPGIFMGMHTNRLYCGKCHLTYLIKGEADKL